MIKEEHPSDQSILINRTISISNQQLLNESSYNNQLNQNSPLNNNYSNNPFTYEDAGFSFKCINRLTTLNKSNFHIKSSKPRNSSFIITSNRSEYSDKKIKTINDYKANKRERNRKSQLVASKEDNNPFKCAELIRKSKDTTRLNFTDQKAKKLDVLITICCIVSVFLSALDTELHIQKTIRYFNTPEIKFDFHELTYQTIQIAQERIISSMENFLRVMDIIVSLVTCLLLYWRYKLKIIQINNEYTLTNYDSLRSAGLLKEFIYVIIQNSIFYPPKINVFVFFNRKQYPFAISLNSLFFTLHIGKLSYLKEAIVNLSSWNTSLAKSICKNNQVRFGYDFVMRCHLEKWGIISFIVRISALLTILTLLLHSFEFLTHIHSKSIKGRLNNNDLQRYFNCLWLIMESMAKLSIGDYYPQTAFGYGVIFIANITGMSLVMICIYKVSSSYTLTNEERKAFEKLTKLLNWENNENKAANVIKTLVHLRKLSKQRHDELSEHEFLMQKVILMASLRTNTKYFMNDYTIAHSYGAPVNDLFETMQNKIEYNMTGLYEQLNKMGSVEQDLEDLALQQECLQCSLKNVTKMNREINAYITLNNNTLIKAKRRTNKARTNSTRFIRFGTRISSIPSKVIFGTSKYPHLCEDNIESVFEKIKNDQCTNKNEKKVHHKDHNRLRQFHSNNRLSISNLSPNPSPSAAILKKSRSKKKRVTQLFTRVIKRQKEVMTIDIIKKKDSLLPEIQLEY